MIIKINNVNNYNKIKILKKVDIVHFHISEAKKLNALTLSEFKEFKESIPVEIKTSCSIDEWINLDETLINSLLSELKVDYFECEAPEYFKEEETKYFIQKIKNIKHRKIISGIQLYPEENISDEIKGMSSLSLLAKDIAYFEIHLESLINCDYYGFNKTQINEIENFCKNYPVLLSDSFDSKKSLTDYKIKTNKGYFFKLKPNTNQYADVKTYGIRELYRLIN